MNFIQGEVSANHVNKIGIVVSRFNTPVTEKLEAGAIERAKELGLTEDHMMLVRVPGAVEIPMAVQLLLEQGCQGVAAIGAVIRGDTSHFDYVCNSVERGCTRLQLDYKKPVIFGVITTENAEQAYDRCGGKKGHKGKEAIDTLLEMIDLHGILNKQKL